MGTLGAVYGISFVAGSLASMGSAYMASNIYKIEDEALVGSEVPIEGQIRGGDKKSDLETLITAYYGMKQSNSPEYKRIAANIIKTAKRITNDNSTSILDSQLITNMYNIIKKSNKKEDIDALDQYITSSKEYLASVLNPNVTTPSGFNPPNNKCLQFVRNWLDKRVKDKQAITDDEIEFALKGVTKDELQQCLAYFNNNGEKVQILEKNRLLTEEEKQNLRKEWDEKSKEIVQAQLKAKEEELKAKIEEEARIKAETERLQQINNEKAQAEKAQAEKAEAERLLTQAKLKEEAQAKEEADKKYEEAIIRAKESELKAEADRKEEKLKEQKEKAFKLAEKNSSFFDVITAIDLDNNTKKQSGGADGNQLLLNIIENGAFNNDGTSKITSDNLTDIQTIISTFSTEQPLVFENIQTKFNSEIGNINKRRKAKILTVTSWLRKVPNKTNITEKDISDIVPDSLSLKQFIDILSNMTKLDDKKKPTIRINKNTFTKASDVILPSYVLDDTIKILTNKLDDKIEIKDLIKYFQSNGTVYTFFKFKNILRLMYDYTLGEIDTIIIHLSKVMKWLNEIKSSNKITNADIEKFKKDNDNKVNILVDTLHFLIKEGVLIKSKLIRVSDFNAIETLDPDNLDRNTKIISWLIDPSRATLPKPTKEQYLMILKELGLSKIEKDMMKVPTLFVGPVVLPDVDPKTEGTSTIQPTEYIRGVELLQKIEGTIKNRGEVIKEFGEKVKGYEKIEREKKSKEFMSKTEKAEKEKLIKDVTEKDRKIKELEQAEKKLKEDDAIKAAAQKTFNERLKKAVEKQNLIGLESLLKERDLQLSKEYETVKKESENKNKGLIKPPNLDQAIWDKLLSEIGAIKDPLKLAEYTNKFKTDNPSIDITPFPDVEKMINAIYSAKQSKENKEKGNNTNSNLKICKNAKVGDKCRDQDNNFNVITKTGGYRQTLRNHLRSNRSSTRRYI
jgi:hypothetical protein